MANASTTSAHGSSTADLALIDVVSADPPSPARPRPPAPLLPAAMGLMAGIVVDYYLAPPLAWSAAILLAGILTAIGSTRRRWIAMLGLTLAASAVGAMRHDLAFRRLPADHIFRFSRPESFIAHVQGRVASIPQIIETDPSSPRAFDSGPRTRFILESTEIAGERGPIAVQGRIAVSIKAPVLLLAIGDTVSMTGWLYRPAGPRNPGEYDRALGQRRSGIWVAMSADEAESVRVLAPIPSQGRPQIFTDSSSAQSAVQSLSLSTLLPRLRTHLARYLIHDAFEDEQDTGAGVMEAMVLGQRGAVPRAMNDAFIRTGNAHFLAASGMNVGWLALMAWGVMWSLGIYYRTRAVVIAALIVSYTLAAEPEPSILRAGIVGLLGCLALFIRGRPSVLNWLACSAIVVLLIDPCDLFRPGFQLSFLAVLAVMHVAPRLLGMLDHSRWAREHALPPVGISGSDKTFPLAPLLRSDSTRSEGRAHGARRSRVRSLAERALRAILLCLCVSIACTITTAPLVCYHFNQLSLWAPIGTFVLWLPAFLATLVGYAKVAAGLVIPSSAAIFGPLLSISTTLMTGTVDVLSRLPYALIDGRSPSVIWVIACYAVLAWWVYGGNAKTPKSQNAKTATRALASILTFRRFDFLTFLLVLWWLGLPTWLPSLPVRWVTNDPKSLQIWCLAVGDGSANVIELPDGRVFIYDFGTRSSFDAGNTAANFLRRRGIKRIDACLVSHADFDHYGAVERIAKELPVGRVILNDQFEPSAQGKPAVKHFMGALRAEHVPIETTSGPTKILDESGVKIETVWPLPLAAGVMKRDNDCSTVLKVAYQGRSVLLPGDIADEAMSKLLEHGDLHADVLALPHHGSVVHNTKAFIDAVDPTICIRSTGQRRSMTMNGIEGVVGKRRYFSTADDGCVRVRISEGKVEAAAVMSSR